MTLDEKLIERARSLAANLSYQTRAEGTIKDMLYALANALEKRIISENLCVRQYVPKETNE